MTRVFFLLSVLTGAVSAMSVRLAPVIEPANAQIIPGEYLVSLREPEVAAFGDEEYTAYVDGRVAPLFHVFHILYDGHLHCCFLVLLLSSFGFCCCLCVCVCTVCALAVILRSSHFLPLVLARLSLNSLALSHLLVTFYYHRLPRPLKLQPIFK
jgi:hypothetical protein